MKKNNLFAFTLMLFSVLSFQLQAGVGGSVGGSGKGDKPSKFSLQYYLESNRHTLDIPHVFFIAPSGWRTHLPVTDLCVRAGEQLETIHPISVPYYSENREVLENRQEVLVTERLYKKTIREFRWFKEALEYEVDARIPLKYQINVYSMIGKRDQDEKKMVKSIDFTIPQCE